MIQLNNMNNEPMMFINTVTKINNFSGKEKKESKVDSVIINKVNELVTMNKGRLHLYSEGAYLHNDYGKIKTDLCAYWKGTIIYINLPLNNPKTLKNIDCDEDDVSIKINYQ